MTNIREMISKATKKAKRKRSAILFGNSDAYDILCSSGYTSLDQNPEVMTDRKSVV